MRLDNFGTIGYGKEDEEEIDELERTDIIYRVFLGDRQVWEKVEEEEDTSVKASKKIITTWKIVKEFNLANVTAATSITGTIDWGDNDTDNWRSGNNYYHSYVTEGIYNITLNCKSFLENATIGQIRESTNHGYLEFENTLIGVTMGLIPFNEHLLGYENLGVFENITTIKEVIVPKGIKEVPKRLFYNTSFEELELPSGLEKIGDYAFVSNKVKTIKVPSSVSNFGVHCLGYNTDGDIVNDLSFKCSRGSAADAYATANGIVPIYE